MHAFQITCLLLGLSISVASGQVVYTTSQESTNTILQPFDGGLARIQENNQIVYINRKGEKLIISETNGVIVNDPVAIKAYEEEQKNGRGLPKNVLKYHADSGCGVLSPTGEVLLMAAYDEVDIKFQQFWKLKKDNKISMYLPDNTVLPFFEDIGYLDGEYFDVMQDGKWYLYHKTQQKIVSGAYDKFDYCGGCSIPPRYVYAQKGGKWGIIDWQENVLIPFQYDHTHHGMRGDNWVTSFSKDGHPVTVNIRTQEEFLEGEVLMGMLIIAKEGKYGAYGQDGTLVVPFDYDKITTPNANYYLGYRGDYLLTTKQRKTGVIDLGGNVIIPNEYDELIIYDDYFVGRKNNISYLLNKKHEVLFEVENGQIAHLSETFYSSGSNGINVFKFHTNALYGLYFADSGKTISPQFYEVERADYAFDGREDLPYIRAEKQGVFNLFDHNGEPIVPGEYQAISVERSFPSLFIKVKRDELTGIYDRTHQREIIPIQYRDVEVLDSLCGLIIAKDGDYDSQLIHLYDFTGSRLIDEDLKQIYPVTDDTYLMQYTGDGTFALYHGKYRTVYNLPYKAVYDVGSDKVILVSDDSKTGKLYDILLLEELSATYDTSNFTYRDRYDDTGEQTTPRKYPILHRFINKMAIIEGEQGVGYINEQGNVILEPTFAKADPFSASGIGLVANYTGEYYRQMRAGYVDTTGNFIFPMQDTENLGALLPHEMIMNEFVLLFNTKNNNWNMGLGNVRTREIVIPIEYSFIRGTFDQAYFLLQQGDKWGIADRTGAIILPAVYDGIKISDALFRGSKPQDLFPVLISEGGKWKYMNEDGTYLPVVGDYIYD